VGNRRRATPAELAGSWPDLPSADPAGEAARRFALNLQAAIRGRSVRSVAMEAGIDESTIRKVLAGAAWPDLRTISMLEAALGVELHRR